MSRTLIYITVLPVALYALLHGAAYLWPIELWGVDFFRYYPALYLVLFLALASALCCLALSRQRLRTLVVVRCGARFLERPGWVGQATRLVALPLFFVLAYALRVREHALGDSQLRFAELEKFYALTCELSGPLAVWLRIVQEGNLRFESLDFALHLLVYSVAQYFGSWTPEDAYAWPSFLAGCAYLLVLWSLCAELGETALERFSHFALGATLGLMQLFFGYGESYTLVTVCAALYLLLALRCARGGSLLYPALCWCLCVLLHMIAASLLFSLLYLVWLKIERPGQRYWVRREVQLVAWPVALVAGLCLYAYLYPIRMPLWVPDEVGQYALFSLGHAQLLLNAALLVSPFGLLWGVAAWAKNLVGDSRDGLLAWAAWGPLGLVFFHNAFLGGRDWDLLSFPGLFCALWGARALLRFPCRVQALALLWTAVLPLMVLHTGVWVGLNANARRVHARTVNLLQFSNQSTHYRHYAMGYYYAMREGETAGAIRHFRLALETLPAADEQYVLRAAKYKKWLGRVLVRDEQYAAAYAELEWAFASQDGGLHYEQDAPFLNDLVVACLKLCLYELREGNSQRAQGYLKQAIAYCQRVLAVREDGYAYLYLGYALDVQERFDEASAAFYKSLKLLTNRSAIIDAYSSLAQSLEMMGEPDLAVGALQEGAVRVNSARLYEDLAALYARYEQFDQAQEARAAGLLAD